MGTAPGPPGAGPSPTLHCRSGHECQEGRASGRATVSLVFTGEHSLENCLQVAQPLATSACRHEGHFPLFQRLDTSLLVTVQSCSAQTCLSILSHHLQSSSRLQYTLQTCSALCIPCLLTTTCAGEGRRVGLELGLRGHRECKHVCVRTHLSMCWASD